MFDTYPILFEMLYVNSDYFFLKRDENFLQFASVPKLCIEYVKY